jgi:hypothetical protein
MKAGMEAAGSKQAGKHSVVSHKTNIINNVLKTSKHTII